MALFPERGSSQVSEGVQPTTETPQIPETAQRAGVTTPLTEFTAQVKDNNGQDVIQPTAQTLEVPADNVTLTSWAKGSITSSLTWFGAFWLRIIKKAVHFGWRTTTANANSS